MRQFYTTFPIGQTVVGQLNWSSILLLLPMKDENKRNYYINLCITHSLSKRELETAIKSNSYERLLDKPDKIEMINNEINQEYHIKEHIKNPIVITLSKKDIILKEKDLQLKILAELKNFFMELGEGYAFIGNEYKIRFGNKTYRIDILLFNVELNAYVVVELKTRELKATDKGQIELYMNMVDNTLKRNFHNKTIGIIVSKYQDKFIVSFVSSPNLILLTYELHETT